MGRKRKLWSRTIEEKGVAVRLYEREPRGVIYRDVWTGDTRDRKSLGHADRKLAEKQAKGLAEQLAELQKAGPMGTLTFGQLVGLYRQHRFPLLSSDRQRAMRGHLAFLERHIARDRLVDKLSQHDIDAYTAARRSGALESPNKRGETPGVRDGTIRNELLTLQALLNWGADDFKVAAKNPLRRAKLPREWNAKRPLATEERYQQLVAVADRADPEGCLRVLLALARHTGRRINALANLRASDVLLSRDQMVTALAEIGVPIAWAEQWPHGALRFAKRFDKRGRESVVPLSREAGRWLRRAEQLAGLPKLARGAWHPFRRQWASERRHLPSADVMAAGGWKSLRVMQESYQHADGAGMLHVVESPESRPKPSEPDTRVAHAERK